MEPPRSFKKTVMTSMVIALLAVAVLVIKFSNLNRPNIILIGIDTLRADHLGCYGYDRKTSPNIDAFSKDAVLFENAISQAPYTAPAFMSIFTSLTPAVHGVKFSPENKILFSLNQQIKTIPVILKENGYFTIGLHGGGEVSKILGFGRGFDVYRPWWMFKRERADFKKLPEKIDDVRKAIEQSKKSGKPLFLFLHHYFCHDPYLSSPEQFSLVFLSERVQGLPVRLKDIELGKGFDAYRKNFWQNVDLSNPKHRNHIISLYDGGVYYSDYMFGEVMKLLKEQKYYDNSIIILVSDHGEEFYEHLDKLHYRLFVETLHVPLIVKFPKSEYGGRVIRELTGTINIMPALFDFLRIKIINFVQGVSFMPLITGKGDYHPFIVSDAEQDVFGNLWYARLYSNGFVYSNQPSAGTNEWLFDTRNDPNEMNNLANHDSAVLNRMRLMAKTILDKDAMLREKTGRAVRGDFEEKDRELREQLKSLGYLQ